MTLLDERPSDDWLLSLTPPNDPDPAFVITLPDGTVSLDVVPAVALSPFPGTEPVVWAAPGVIGWEDNPVLVLPPPSAEVARFTAAVAALDVDLTSRTDVQALADLELLLTTVERLRVVQLGRFSDAVARNLARLGNAVSLNTFVRRSYDDASRADIRLSGQIRRYPSVQQHVRSGELTVSAATEICRVLDKLAKHLDRPDGLIDGLDGDAVLAGVIGHVVDQVAGSRLGLPDGHPLLVELQAQVLAILASSGSQLEKVEAGFVLLGRHVPLAYLAGVLIEQRDALLPEKLENDAYDAYRQRGVTLQPNFDRPTSRIIIDPDAELYELVHTVIGAEARRDPDNPTDTKDKASGLADCGLGYEAAAGITFGRSKTQRHHDALKLALQKYLDAGLAGSYEKAPVGDHRHRRTRPGRGAARGASGQGRIRPKPACVPCPTLVGRCCRHPGRDEQGMDPARDHPQRSHADPFGAPGQSGSAPRM